MIRRKAKRAILRWRVWGGDGENLVGLLHLCFGGMPGCVTYYVFCFCTYVEFVWSEPQVFHVVKCSIDLEQRQRIHMLGNMETRVQKFRSNKVMCETAVQQY